MSLVTNTILGGNIMEGVLASMAADAQGTQERLRMLMVEQERTREANTRLINELQATGAELARKLRSEQLPANCEVFSSELATLSQKIIQITGEVNAEQVKQAELTGLLATLRTQNEALRQQEMYWKSQGGQDARAAMYTARCQAAKAAQDAAQRAHQEAERLRTMYHRWDSDGNNK